MGGNWQWGVTACVCLLLTLRVNARPLESLKRQYWVPLDSTTTDQTTDVATGAGGSLVYISGYKLASLAADGSQNLEALLMAYNSSGVQQWVVQYGSSGDDLGSSVAADSTGVYLAGTASVQSNDTGADEQDDTDAFVVKYNSTGGLLWKTSWGTSEPDLGNGVAVDGGSGLVYVVGTTRGSMGADVMVPGSGEGGEGEEGGGENGDSGGGGGAVNAGASDVFLTCLGAADGEIRWTQQFGSAAADVGNRVAVGPRGGVFLVGQLGDDDDTSLAGARAFLAKYDYLGNAQFTARLNSSSTHYAVDLAPSLGSGGEGVVYMSGHTLGDSSTVFLARFEGSAGAQTWLSTLGVETGSPHVAQSVSVVEGSVPNGAAEGGAGDEGSASDGGVGAGAPIIEGEAGNDARVVVVGYNTSAASAESHTSTGFTAAANTDGKWTWLAVSKRADRETAIAIGAGGSGSSREDSLAFVVGTVAASEASPGNYLFLDIQKVVREAVPTPPPTATSSSTPGPTALHDPIDGASATTGLSQDASLWLLIIAPILVVVSCILMVGYVSKQCAIAFGAEPHSDDPMVTMEFSSHGNDDRNRGRGASRSMRGLRRAGSSESPSEWRESGGHSGSGRRRSARDGKGGHAWPRSVAASFLDNKSGPPYRKLGTRNRDSHGDRGGIKASPSGEEEGGEAGGEVELRSATHLSPSDYSPRGRGAHGGIGGEAEGRTRFDSPNNGGRTADQGVPGGPAWEVEGRSNRNGNPPGDEPVDAEAGSSFGPFEVPRLV